VKFGREPKTHVSTGSLRPEADYISYIKVNPSTIAVKFRHVSGNHEFQLSECPPRKGLLVTGLAAGERAALPGDIWRTSGDFIPPTCDSPVSSPCRGRAG